MKESYPHIILYFQFYLLTSSKFSVSQQILSAKLIAKMGRKLFFEEFFDNFGAKFGGNICSKLSVSHVYTYFMLKCK